MTLRSDPSAPGLEAAPFQVVGASSGTASVFDNGMATPAVDWISGGTLTNLIRPRAWALKTTAPATAAVDNLILEDATATATQDEMLASTERGLLLTTSGTSARSIPRPCCSPVSPVTASSSWRAAR